MLLGLVRAHFGTMSICGHDVPKQLPEVVGQVLEQAGLIDRGKDKYRTYSLGMKQRLAIAATLLKSPTC